eukprot:COSAG05_NODE_24148_length_253_cov_1.006494_1_plen_54_part_10
MGISTCFGALCWALLCDPNVDQNVYGPVLTPTVIENQAQLNQHLGYGGRDQFEK